MGIFTKKKAPKLPEEVAGMEIKIQTSVCTGEKTIGFYNRRTRELMYPELVRSQEDISAFYEKYGISPDDKE